MLCLLGVLSTAAVNRTSKRKKRTEEQSAAAHGNCFKYREKILRDAEMNGQTPVMEADLEDALEFAGAGRYQLTHGVLMLFTLFSAILEMIGVAFILPAAACDLEVPDNLKGIITALPNIGIILTATCWGRVADHFGRKPVLLGSLIAAGTMGLIAAFMPTLLAFVLFKFACSLFLSGPSSVGYAYITEMLPRRRRDGAVLIINGLGNVMTVLSPGLAWLILSFDWHYQIGVIDLRPWRLLTAVYALPLLLTALWMVSADESPKFLMFKGQEREALELVKRIYVVNTGLTKESFCVKSLKTPCTNDTDTQGSECVLTPKSKPESALALLRPPHLKWFALTGLLMFGLFSFLNGLFLFAADSINKVMSSDLSNATVCELMIPPSNNSTSTLECVDSISHQTFYIMVVTTLVYGLIVTGASMSPASKKTLLVSMFVVVGVGCLVTGLSTNRILAGIAFSSLQISALGIGPLTAYIVDLFPTSLRGTAVGAGLMFGRMGAVVGANIAGVSLSAACTATFYGFALLVFLCAALSLLLPADRNTKLPQTGTNS